MIRVALVEPRCACTSIPTSRHPGRRRDRRPAALPDRGTTLSTTTARLRAARAAHARRSLLAARAVLNNTPDTAIVATPLDALPLGLAGADGHRRPTRCNTLVATLADLLLRPPHRRHRPRVAGWDVSAGAPTSDDDTLDAHTAAIRGLFAAYLATGDMKYRDRAIAVYQRVRGDVLRPRRAHLPARGAATRSSTVTYTPAALRAAAGHAARHVRARRVAAGQASARAQVLEAASRASTSSCSTAGTTATATSSSTGPSECVQRRRATACRAAACRWPSAR